MYSEASNVDEASNLDDNLDDLMSRVTNLQREMLAAQADLAETEATGTAGGGLVVITMRGTG
jgi:DNA-binding protein YbaB